MKPCIEDASTPCSPPPVMRCNNHRMPRQDLVGLIVAGLADRDWLLGDFGVADVICAGVAGITHRAELTHEPERVRAYVDRARSRPANRCAASRTELAPS